jgi:hypothetical protein
MTSFPELSRATKGELEKLGRDHLALLTELQGGKDVKSISVRCCVLALTAMAGAIALSQNAAAQSTIVVGTGNPDTDVAAVQAAVNNGGTVILQGHFSFNRAPTVPTAGSDGALAMVLVSQAVTISGKSDDGDTTDDDEIATIDGGTIPFYVNAPGQSVSIEALRFITPTRDAIFVYAVNGLTVASCRIEGIVPSPGAPGNPGIDISTTGGPVPTPAKPGHPENIYGTLSITNNKLDLTGGGSLGNTLGVNVFSVGQSPDKEADIYVSGNHISNVTEPAINFRRVAGQVHVEHNMLTTGVVAGTSPEVIRAVNTGTYLIAHNLINCQWGDPQAKGIAVFSGNAVWPMQGASVLDNEVVMSPPPDSIFGELSAAIEIRGFAQNNVVAHNLIRGRARAALAIDPFNGGLPSDNALILNRVENFEATTADVFIGVGVTNTLILGEQGTIEDLGINTLIVATPFHP